MKIRPYIENTDYLYLEKWVKNERIHAMWCANLIQYHITKDKFHAFLKKNAINYSDCAFTAIDDNEEPIGFFCYSVDSNDNSGFFKFVVIDNKKRGKGYGKGMLRLAMQYAFDKTGVKTVKLNVFNENIMAKRCYENVGFVELNVDKDVFAYKDELWSKCAMEATKKIFNTKRSIL